MVQACLCDWLNFLFLSFMGADFSKFPEMFKFALQILLAGNPKRLKAQPTTKSRHQKHKERSGMAVCSLSSAPLESNSLLSQNKTYHVAATQVSQFVSKMRRRKALLKTISIQQKGFLGPNEYLLN
jgi:hypothetical protein